jgi:ABC-type proline/glycine betaine transport system ATPase subunit
VSVGRCTFETLTKPTQEFVESFCENLLVLKKHSFIAKKKKSEHYNFVKKNVKENEAVVSLNFAENYGFVIQDKAQSFHWNNDQATIFTIAVHYRDCNDVKLRSIVCISEHLEHDTLAVHVFQKKLISYLRSELIPDIKKITTS